MSGSDWTPVHHVEADDPEVQNPAGQKPAAEKREAKSGGNGAGVTLTLALPDDFTKAVVKAIEENTKVLQAILAKLGGE